MLCKFTRWSFGIGLSFAVFLSSKLYAIPYVRGVDYLPEHYYVVDENNDDNALISDNDIEKDFFVMSKNFNAIRTYQYDPINLQRILRAAKRYDMKVALGINVSSSKKAETEAQIQGLTQMFEQYPDLKSPVVTIVVGNNVIRNPQQYFSKESTYLLQQIKRIAQFKWFKNSTISLSIAESDAAILSNAGIRFLDQIARTKLQDRVSLLVSINPYMSGCTVEEAIGEKKSVKCRDKSFPARWKKLIARKEIQKFQLIIGETGWPTEGPGAKGPVKTVAGNLDDAIKYYKFLYPFIEDQRIRGVNVSVPFFVFSAFDEPMMGIFGFEKNFWGVYTADRKPKEGMIYPIENRVVMPTPKLGTNIRIYLPSVSHYNDLPILFKTKENIYSNIVPENNQGKPQVYSFIKDYPFVEYSLTDKQDKEESSNVVSIVLPNSSDKSRKAATCTNELISGVGYGLVSDMSLKWKYAKSKEENCQHVLWNANGIWIN